MQIVPVLVAVDKHGTRATACTVANISRVHGLLPLTSLTSTANVAPRAVDKGSDPAQALS